MNFGFVVVAVVVLFLVALSVKLSCLFNVSLASWGRLVLPWASILGQLLMNPIGFGLSYVV